MVHCTKALCARPACEVVQLMKDEEDTHTHHLTALFPGLPGSAGTRKLKPIWISKQETVCTSLQTDNHTSTPPLSFYRPDVLPAAQPTVSKH